MTRELLQVGQRYLLRLRGKQVPVIYNGETDNTVGISRFKALKFQSISTGELIIKSKAGALSRHFDDCGYVAGPPNPCNCKARLETL